MNELKGDLPEDFKMTELGPLPEKWKVTRLGDVIEELKEKNKSNMDLKVFTVSNMEGFVPSDRFFGKRVHSKDTDNYKIVRQGYFAYNPYRINVGSIGLFKETIGLVSPAYVVFKVKRTDCLHPEFLFRLLKSPFYMSEIQRIAMSRGSVRRSLSYRDLSDFKIPLPPLPEQEKIAAVLSAIQEAKEKTEAVISATRDLKKSMMSYLFTYGPVPLPEAESVPLKETEIGMIPEEWEVVNFSEIGKFQYGYTESGSTVKIGPRFLRITDVDLARGNINWSSVPYCKISDVDYPKYELYEGDVLIARIGATTGKTCIIKNPPKSVFASYLIRFIYDKEKVDSFFIYYFTNSQEYWVQVNASKEGKLKKGVSSSQLKNFKAPLPPLPMQQKIASILSAIDQKIEAEEDKKKALEDLFQTLLHNLMTAKIRVNNLEVGV